MGGERVALLQCYAGTVKLVAHPSWGCAASPSMVVGARWTAGNAES